MANEKFEKNYEIKAIINESVEIHGPRYRTMMEGSEDEKFKLHNNNDSWPETLSQSARNRGEFRRQADAS